MGVHESQSLFWECRVARSRAFADRWHPRFRDGLGADPWGGAAGFWRALNPLRPGLIRVEADELSYGLHIVMRFELELALLEQEMPVEELPEQWNRRMGDLLGIQPPRLTPRDAFRTSIGPKDCSAISPPTPWAI